MLVFLFFYLIMLFVATSGNSNHSLMPRGVIATGPGSPGYPYHQTTELWMIPNLPGGLKYASPDVPGLEVTFMIQPDDPNAGGLAGRLAGGGTRRDIYGNKRYGSGYPNTTTEAVEGRDLPFFFGPISYGQYPGYGLTHIYDNEYCGPDDEHRPGGPLYFITIQPPESLVKGPYPEIPPMTLYAIADQPTLKAIGPDVQWSCSRSDYSGWAFTDKVQVSKPKKFKGPAEDPDGPSPEQAVAYYRGSSVVLSLAGYNNTAQATNSSLEDTPLPSVADTPFFRCINETFGGSIPLVVGRDAVPYRNDATSSRTIPQPVFVLLLAVFLAVLQMLF